MDSQSDLAFFAKVIKLGTLIAAAQALDISPPFACKRLAGLEARLGVHLLHRTTRHLNLTLGGEIYAAGSKNFSAGESIRPKPKKNA